MDTEMKELLACYGADLRVNASMDRCWRFLSKDTCVHLLEAKKKLLLALTV
jgi:hypothetical protein